MTTENHSTIKEIEIQARERDTKGRRAARRSRMKGMVPAVVYSATLSPPLQILISKHDALTLLRQNELVLVTLNISSGDSQKHKKLKCIVKEIQTHPVTDSVLHIDFQQIEKGRKVVVKIPIRLTGTSKGEMKGGRVVKKIRSVEIESTPEKLKPFLEVDISALDLNQSLRIEDIKLEEGRLLHHPRLPVATVVMPRRKAAEQEQQQETK